MLQSLFTEYVSKYFAGLVAQVVILINGTKNPLTYRFKDMLEKEYSLTGKWESINSDNTTVAADIVSLDSSLPLKKRDALSSYTGDIPKTGILKFLNEQQLQDLKDLIGRGTQIGQVIKNIFSDTKKVIAGVYERYEYMFLEALSTGITATTDANNVGVLVRYDFGYKAANKFGAASVVWSNGAATPLADIQRVLKKVSADGNFVNKLMMDQYAFDNFCKATDVKNLFAMSLNFSGSNILAPDLGQINRALTNKFGITIEVVERSVRTEKNGQQTATKPWAEGNVIFIGREKVGRLIWAELAEMTFKAEGVDYQTADEYILVSKWHEKNPLKEFTAAQARAIPVIDNVSEIYLLESKTVQV